MNELILATVRNTLNDRLVKLCLTNTIYVHKKFTQFTTNYVNALFFKSSSLFVNRNVKIGVVTIYFYYKFRLGNLEKRFGIKKLK